MSKTGHIVKNLFSLYKSRASRRGIAFTLSREEFERIILSDCYICGSPPSNKRVSRNVGKSVLLYNGIDRVLNDLGYERRNAKPCCWRCNNIKGSMDLKGLELHLKKMIEGLKGVA